MLNPLIVSPSLNVPNSGVKLAPVLPFSQIDVVHQAAKVAREWLQGFPGQDTYMLTSNQYEKCLNKCDLDNYDPVDILARKNACAVAWSQGALDVFSFQLLD